MGGSERVQKERKYRGREKERKRKGKGGRDVKETAEKGGRGQSREE